MTPIPNSYSILPLDGENKRCHSLCAQSRGNRLMGLALGPLGDRWRSSDTGVAQREIVSR